MKQFVHRRCSAAHRRREGAPYRVVGAVPVDERGKVAGSEVCWLTGVVQSEACAAYAKSQSRVLGADASQSMNTQRSPMMKFHGARSL